MNRQKIINEIHRIAKENGGVAPGQELFEKLTGISSATWRGRIWLRWNEAITEAGFTSRQMTTAIPEEILLAKLAELTRKVGHVPTGVEIKFERMTDKSFPSHSVFDRLGSQSQRLNKLRLFADSNPDYSDLLSLLPALEQLEPISVISSRVHDGFSDGYVYMFKHHKHYKIGRTSAVPRRHREIALELPEKPDIVHIIRTDDPEGIEAYWHKRFAKKRTNGEWFLLDLQDIKAFKIRKFM